MAAGLGFKTFNSGDVLSAADVNGYLMQGVLVFASAAARDAAITSPQEGQFAYLKDTNVTTYYTGSAWANLDTTGMVNPMTTTGDTIYSSSGSTPARLGIGSTGQVLTVAGGVPTWATPAGGGITNWTLLNAGGTALTAATTITVSFTAPKRIMVLMIGASSANARSFITLRPNNISTADYSVAGGFLQIAKDTTGSYVRSNPYGEYSTGTDIEFGTMSNNASSVVNGSCVIDLTDQTGWKNFTVMAAGDDTAGEGDQVYFTQGILEASATITSITVISSTGNFDAGTIYVLGAN